MEHHNLRPFEPNEMNWRSWRPRPSGSITMDPKTHFVQAPRPRPSTSPSFETNTYPAQTHRPRSSSKTSVENNPHHTQIHTPSSSSSPSVESDRYSTPAQRPRSSSDSSIDTNPYSTETDLVETPNSPRPPITPIGHEMTPFAHSLNRSLSLICCDFPRPLHYLAALVHASDPDIDHPPHPSHPCVQTLTLVCTPPHALGTAHSPSCRLVPGPTTYPKLAWRQGLWPQTQQTPLFLYRQSLTQTQAQADAMRHWEDNEGYKMRMWRQLRVIPEEKKQDSEREGERYLGVELRAQMRRVLRRSGDVDVALGLGLGLGAKRGQGRKGGRERGLKARQGGV